MSKQQEKVADGKPTGDDLRALAAAMNHLADSINQTNALIAEARREDPNWKTLPTTFTEIARQLRMLCSRLT